MKLYTEEQVKQAMHIYANSQAYFEQYMDEKMAILNNLKPIELPSDEEIENGAKWLPNEIENLCFKEGAKWMLEQILNQKK